MLELTEITEQSPSAVCLVFDSVKRDKLNATGCAGDVQLLLYPGVKWTVTRDSIENSIANDTRSWTKTTVDGLVCRVECRAKVYWKTTLC